MTVLRHGYTLADVKRLAESAAANNHTMAADHRDLVHAAWSAIVDLLYASDQPPARHDLARAGKAAIWQLVRDHRQTYGYRDRDPWAGIGSAPRFATYWHLASEAPYEEAFVDRMAVLQVVAALGERDRTVLLAAAAFDGDYHAAAVNLGMPRSSFTTYLSQARRACAVLWLEPETPHRHRGTVNRRRHRGEVAPCGTQAAARRHRSRGERLCELCAPVESAYDKSRKQRRKTQLSVTEEAAHG